MKPGSFWHTVLGHAVIMTVALLMVAYGKRLTSAHPVLTVLARVAASVAYGLGVAALIKYAPTAWKRPN